MTSPVSGIGVGIVLLLVGVAIAGGGVHLHQDAKGAKAEAVEVEATVLSSAVERERSDGKAGGSKYVYYPRIEYQYTYEGERYTSTNLCPGAGSGCDAAQNERERSEVEAFVSDYPEDETVTAYVSPDDPSASFLVRSDASSTQSYLFLVGFGGLVGLLGLAMFVGSVKQVVAG